MITKYFKIIFVLTLGMLFFVTKSDAKPDITEQRAKIVMRKIGHEILLNAGDSTSRVLPIEKKDTQYKIAFESNFLIDPSDLVVIIELAIKKSNIANAYLVEMKACKTEQVVYSYEIGTINNDEFLPCGGRTLPFGCYNIFITLLDSGQQNMASFSLKQNANFQKQLSAESEQTNYILPILLLTTVVFLGGFFVYTRQQKTEIEPEPIIDLNIITIGKYQFDEKNMTLSLDNKTVDLTSKEADLLTTLYTSANETLKREEILKAVWGDEGDYVGRTLDVFISKLRKKLGGDENVKIVNVRGVGYRMVIND